MLHDFELRGNRVRFWQRTGESYEHILMKALGFAMFVEEFPHLEIEKKVGLRYKPDLVAQNINGAFEFWGEAGSNAVTKTLWLLKHAKVEKLALFKIYQNAYQLSGELREEIPAKYRANERLTLINFVPNIVQLTQNKKIDFVKPEWFEETKI